MQKNGTHFDKFMISNAEQGTVQTSKCLFCHQNMIYSPNDPVKMVIIYAMCSFVGLDPKYIKHGFCLTCVRLTYKFILTMFIFLEKVTVMYEQNTVFTVIRNARIAFFLYNQMGKNKSSK